MSAPFRDLFVELPRAVFETLQAIGEQAVRGAGGVADMNSSAFLFKSAYAPPRQNPWLTDFAARALAQRYGFRELELRRAAHANEVIGYAIRSCGHRASFRVSEIALAIGVRAEVIDVFDAAADAAERECCCMVPL